MRTCRPDTKIVVLHGIHGLSDGSLGSTDKILISCFTYAIDLVHEEDEQLIKEKNISIKGVILKTNDLDIVRDRSQIT